MIKKIILLLAFVAIIALAGYLYIRSTLFVSNVNESKDAYELFIPSNSSYATVVDSLKEGDVLKDITSFEVASKFMKYDNDKVPAGRYILTKGMTNRSIIVKLRSGNQDAVKMTFNNLRTIEELCGQIANNIEADSNEVYNVVMSPDFLDDKGLNPKNVMTLFIPNTYEMYWNTKANAVIEKLIKENEKFWNANDRKVKLEKLGMTREEVYILASIVEKESNLKSERPTVAGVYLNRLRQGIKLQADPTVVFATGDFELRRVLLKHLEMDSPYNTYRNLGLPPGPIYMPSINSIDAVLADEQHEYIFFCAKPGYNSGHLFAKTNSQHEANARTYHSWLRSQNIK